MWCKSTWQTLNALRDISSRLDYIFKCCSEITTHIDNADITRTSTIWRLLSTGENAETTIHLCLQLFSLIGAKDATISDSGIDHRLPACKSSTDRPYAILCSFTRRLANKKKKVQEKSFLRQVQNILPLILTYRSRWWIYSSISPQDCKTYFTREKKFKQVHKKGFCN